MKMLPISLVVLLFSTLFFTNCGLDNSYFFYRNYERDVVMTATIGSPMTIVDLEYRNNVYGNVRDKFESGLTYSGKAGTVLKIVYREFSNDMARPAFTQDLQYDLSESDTIRFRQLAIKVLHATNQEISFKVLESTYLNYNNGKLTDQDMQNIKNGNAGVQTGTKTGSIGVSVNASGEIISVWSGGAAELAGIKQDDMIETVNGKRIPAGDSEYIASLLSGPVGSQVNIFVWRNAKELNFTITRK